MLCALTIRSTTAEDPPQQYSCPPMPTEASPVFEGAMGWAKFAFANPPQNYNPNFWYEVTSAEDYLPGTTPIEHTLRWAVEHLNGPRNIKVLVNGRIKLKSGIRMENQSYVKITGEYAAGEGPTITDSDFIIIDCNNIVVRYIRFRSRDEGSPHHCTRSLSIFGYPGSCNDVIVDHCSIGSSGDDNISVFGKMCRLTVQNCIIGGGAVGESKAGIGSGGSFYAGGYPAHEYETVTFCRNFITNTRERQLIFAGPGRTDFFNNLVSINRHALQLFASDGTHNPRINVIANHFHTANNHQLRGYFEDPIRAIVVTNPYTPSQSSLPLLVTSGNDDTIHISENLYMRFNLQEGEYQQVVSATTDPQWQLTYSNTPQHDPPGEEPDFPSSLEKNTPFDMPSDTILDAVDVEEHALANAGCRLPLADPALDDYDLALVDAHLITGPSPSNAIFPENGPLTDGNPGIPALVAPTHQATGVSTTVTLEWQASDETDDYVVYLGTSTPLTNPTTNTTNTQWQATDLQGNTQYFWRVVARDGCNHTSGSEVRSFTTE